MVLDRRAVKLMVHEPLMLLRSIPTAQHGFLSAGATKDSRRLDGERLRFLSNIGGVKNQLASLPDSVGLVPALTCRWLHRMAALNG